MGRIHGDVRVLGISCITNLAAGMISFFAFSASTVMSPKLG